MAFDFKNPKTYRFLVGDSFIGPVGSGVAVPEVSLVVPTISVTFIFIKLKIFYFIFDLFLI